MLLAGTVLVASSLSGGAAVAQDNRRRPRGPPAPPWGPGRVSSIFAQPDLGRVRDRNRRLLVCIPRKLRASGGNEYRLLAAVVCIVSAVTAQEEIQTRSWKMADLCGRRSGTICKKSRKCSGGLTLRKNVLPRREAGSVEALSKESGAHFADDYVETLERRYTDLLAIDVIEMRWKMTSHRQHTPSISSGNKSSILCFPLPKSTSGSGRSIMQRERR